MSLLFFCYISAFDPAAKRYFLGKLAPSTAQCADCFTVTLLHRGVGANPDGTFFEIVVAFVTVCYVIAPLKQIGLLVLYALDIVLPVP